MRLCTSNMLPVVTPTKKRRMGDNDVTPEGKPCVPPAISRRSLMTILENEPMGMGSTDLNQNESENALIEDDLSRLEREMSGTITNMTASLRDVWGYPLNYIIARILMLEMHVSMGMDIFSKLRNMTEPDAYKILSSINTAEEEDEYKLHEDHDHDGFGVDNDDDDENYNDDEHSDDLSSYASYAYDPDRGSIDHIYTECTARRIVSYVILNLCG